MSDDQGSPGLKLEVRPHHAVGSKRLSVDESVADDATGLTPRLDGMLALAPSRAVAARIGEAKSPRQAASAGMGEPSEAFMVGVASRGRRGSRNTQVSPTKHAEVATMPVLELEPPMTPALPPKPAADEAQWHTIPVRRRKPRQPKGAVPEEAQSAARASPPKPPEEPGDGPDADGQDHDVLYTAHGKEGRNPRGKQCQTFNAALKRRYAIDKRNMQRGRPKR